MAQEAQRKLPPYTKRYREFWHSERAAAWLYRKLAELADEDGAKTFEALANAEESHAAHWEELLRKSGITDLQFERPPLREGVIAFAAGKFGLERVLPTLMRLEAADAGKTLA